MELPGLGEPDLVRLDPQRREPTSRAVGEHDPYELPAVRLIVVEPGMHEDFFHRRGEALGAVLIDVEQRRRVADRARVRLVPQSRKLDPVELMR